MLINESIFAVTPFQYPDVHLALALAKARIYPFLDLGIDNVLADKALQGLSRYEKWDFGIRIPEGCTFNYEELPKNVKALLYAELSQFKPVPGKLHFIQVISLKEAIKAEKLGVDGIIVKGNEAGGRVGKLNSFVLLQQIKGKIHPPYWIQGGMGIHTAPAAYIAGAQGIVLDSQLALLEESRISSDLKKIIKNLDGSETQVYSQYRFYVKPGSTSKIKPDSRPEEIYRKFNLANKDDYYLPCGQDIGFAKHFAQKYNNVENVVYALQQSVESQIRNARNAKILQPDSSLAQNHRTRYPVVQGPMSSVSDSPEFALKVAEAGGLPFIALSLMDEEIAGDILMRTKSQLNNKSWGVGLLGFIPRQIYKKQVASIFEAKPSFAIIAGGRPSQAREFDDAGITCYLHVPSPGLMDLFLKEGAKKFIFEGRECGGHVGPLSSFALWELQIQKLLSLDNLSEISVLFAGGIHDRLSAAMVASIAAPLAARGTKIGVLLGTPYIYTKEIVETGALLKLFQKKALENHPTVLLESALGQATRCLNTSYARFFNQEKERLRRSSISSEEIQKHLEQLNVGRLRVAAKGLKWEDKIQKKVDPENQEKNGLYMIGQTAVMKQKTNTIKELHREISEGSGEFLKKATIREIKYNESPDDIAIIGMACVYPGARNMEEFWANIVQGKDCITDVPESRWNKNLYFDPSSNGGNKSYSHKGGFIPSMLFDPVDYGIPPQSLASIEPVQLLSLEIANQALIDAGYGKEKKELHRENAAVIFGIESGNDLGGLYGFRAMYPQIMGEIPQELDERLPKFTEDSFPGVLGNIVTGRIANRLDLRGPNYTVNAACGSSLTAIDVAIKELRFGKSSLVLAGGADLHNSVSDYIMFCNTHALSRKGKCRTFDIEGDGTILGEGIAVVVLKRLEDAIADEDRIYAVIKGSGSSSDGKSLGLTAPRLEGQVRALNRAYQKAGVSPSEVTLIEAHGTATVVGDRTELKALTEVYTNAGTSVQSCALGSVKTQIGHTKCAAGLAGVIKAALSIYHSILPPTLHLNNPNNYYDRKYSPFYFNQTAIPWAREQRKSAVSALGFGGTNFHVVLDQPRPGLQDHKGYTLWPYELILIKGKTQDKAVQRIEEVEKYLNNSNDKSFYLKDIAYTLSQDSEPVQIAFLANSLADLKDKLMQAKTFQENKALFYAQSSSPNQGKIAFLFSGQGAQRTGMAADLFMAFPQMQKYLQIGSKWYSYIFPGAVFSKEEKKALETRLTETNNAQPALGIVEMALADLLTDFGVKADMVAGHSYGELAACAYAGAISATDLFSLSEKRGQSILTASQGNPGTMIVVKAAYDKIQSLINAVENVWVANLNTPEQTALAGTQDGIDNIAELLSSQGFKTSPIKVSCPFHSPLIEKAQALFAKELATVSWQKPKIPIWSNTYATTYEPNSEAIKRTLAQHIIKPVLYSQQIEAMYAAGTRIFIEVGPGRIQTNFMAKILKDRKFLALATDNSGEHGLKTLLTTLASLITNGISVNPGLLFQGRRCTSLDFHSPKTIAKTAWRINGQCAVPINSKSLSPSQIPITEPVVVKNKNMNHSLSQNASKDTIIMQYLSTINNFMDTQKDIMLQYLGKDTSPTSIMTAPANQVRVANNHTLEHHDNKTSIHNNSEKSEETVQQPRINFQQELLNLVSEKTGYPLDMLELNLDLESDLSIDSIKRIEILGELQVRLGMDSKGDTDQEALLEELASIKTLQGIIDWFKVNNQKRESSESNQGKSKKIPDFKNELLHIVSEKTGYPLDMLELDLDLEADLSIDSIKRIEILGELTTSLGMSDLQQADQEPLVEELAGIKTLRGIIDWLGEKYLPEITPETMSVDIKPGTSDKNNRPMQVEQKGDLSEPERKIHRYIYQLEQSPLPEQLQGHIPGKKFILTGHDQMLAEALQSCLNTIGITLVDHTKESDFYDIDGIIHMATSPLDSIGQSIYDFFTLCKKFNPNKLSWVGVITGLGGKFGLTSEYKDYSQYNGIGGFLKSLAKEWKKTKCKLIDVSVHETPQAIAQWCVQELFSEDSRIEAGYINGQRFIPQIEEVPLRLNGQAKCNLNRDSLIIISGGAKGITSQIAKSFAKQYQCNIVLIGRSQLLDESESAPFAQAQEKIDLRKAIISSGKVKTPGAIETLIHRIMSDREIRKTLADITACGGKPRYYSVDVKNKPDIDEFMKNMYQEYGRIDGFIHSAGIIEDKFFRDKTLESFQRVYETKVKGAQAILKNISNDIQFFVFFSSVSGIFGNKGQTDYAAANDVLDKMAQYLNPGKQGRFLSVNWGPWDNVGMVTEELRKEYYKKGIGLIPLQEGAEYLLNELLYGDKEVSQIVVMNSLPQVIKETWA